MEAELRSRADDLLAALDSDLGKPAVEAWTAEIYFVLAELRLFTRKLKRWARPKRVGSPFFHLPAWSEIRLIPQGTVLIAGPWNYPAQLSLSPLIAAVAAGNTVVLKPSELAPATAQFLENLLGTVFEPEHVAVVQGGPEIGQQLLEQPFDHFFFTGGEKVGRLYAEAAANRLAPATLELGGKCPCVVDRDVRIDRAGERIAAAKFWNAGQTCFAPDFVLVDESIREPLVESLLENLSNADQAKIVNEHHFQRLQRLISEDALRAGEDRPDELRLAPTILPNATWDSPAMEEEIFGPILPVIGYNNLDSALVRLAELPSPLALYAFSKSRQTQEKIAAVVPSGSVCFNDAMKQATNLNLPFGGVGASGHGRYRGRAGLENFSHQRAVTRRWFNKDPFLVNPPYGNKIKQLRKILR
jgi:aldehyde dehydrogenase (NAD+)